MPTQEKRTDVWINEETGSFLIFLDKDSVGLPDGNVEYLGKVFKPKGELHITIVGQDLGCQLQEVIKRNPAIGSRIERAIEETDWSYQKKDKMYHVSKDKKRVDSEGNSGVVYVESIILMMEVLGIERFYRKLSEIIGEELEAPPTHVTLYTHGDPFGIGLPNQETFKEHATRAISPNELRRLSPVNLDQILRSLPEVKAGSGLWQNSFHEFDVYDHTLEFVKCLKGLTDDVNMIAAGYLHDIGKPVVAKPKYEEGIQDRDPGKLYHTFDDHERVGQEMVREMDPELFKGLGLDQDRIALLVGCHYLPMKGIKALRATVNFNDFVREYQNLQRTLEDAPVPKEDILTMFLADKLAQGKYCTDREELFAIKDALLGKEGDPRRIYDLQKDLYGNKE